MEQKDLMKKINDQRRKELEKAGRQVLILTQAIEMITTVMSEIVQEHKYEGFDIQDEGPAEAQ